MEQLEKPPATATAESRKAERRAHVRRACDGEVASCLVDAHSSSWSAQIRNISLGGIGLFMAVPLAAGTLLSVEVRLRGRPRVLRVQVAHCTAEETGWLVGCALLTPLCESELAEWLISS